MSGCAIAPCGRDNGTHAQPGLVFHRGRFVCYLCYVLPVIFTIVRCKKLIKETGTQCEKVEHHPPPCWTARDGKTEAADLKESKPVEVLDGPRQAAIKLGQRKRKREGPHR